MSASFTCAVCNEPHEGFPALAFVAPDPWDWASEAERAADWSLDSDFAEYRETDFYVRGVLDIPIIGRDDVLSFGVWSTVSRDNFARCQDAFNDEDQSKLGPMFGWFSNNIPGYPQTLLLKCNLLPRDGRLRPLIELEPTDHPLAVQQREGVSLEAAAEYFHAYGLGDRD
ncbi:DUF2199 domain-containing protein [Brevundimonas sp. GCM10030266]|uniref:DUF2199 domain-containing protein n=1 Tax=Brevundimonas sp. GCM10030266 TaxID=3273386 RepID=UPI00361B4C2F